MDVEEEEGSESSWHVGTSPPAADSGSSGSGVLEPFPRLPTALGIRQAGVEFVAGSRGASLK